MTYRQRLSLFVFVDTCIVLSAIFISMFLMSSPGYEQIMSLIIGCLTLVTAHHLFALRLKLYKKLWEYASIQELIIILKVVTYSIFIAMIIHSIVLQETQLKLFAVTWLLHMFLIGGSRLIWRIYRDTFINKSESKVRTLIVGAGSAGTMVARQLQKKNEGNLLPVAFIDDDKHKQQMDILGLPVIGGVDSIEKIVNDLDIQHIIISIPSLNKKNLNTIFQECAKTSAKTQILPLLEDLITGKIAVNQFRDVQVEDLLGRPPVELDMNMISQSVTNKVVLVTGAGGSIGSEITRQIASFHPIKLILLGHGENSIYSIELELRDTFKDTSIEFITEIADIQDAQKMRTIMRRHKPDAVYHAAAHKHVPLMERNPDEAVKNNIIGTLNTAMAASLNGVTKFVMISTDKAVNPTSVMGASKRLAEMLIQNMNRESDTTFVTVRFGNVLGSRGSVIPLFKKQIEKGGPVTVTHPDMVRYFMTIPEASRLVIQAGALAKGGEIFVLDMGEPVKIVDLARNLIKLSGHSLEDIEIKFSGIRPGEKLFEELLQDHEVGQEQIYPKIYVGKPTELYIDEIHQIITNYQTMNAAILREELLNLSNNVLPTQPTEKVVITI
ncbi:polysaccharide biosynthesis protein [Oceanobacillus piezotolerans]|uniref:Polysaccharide biosynthesis protein n=1 Tax=Oceanobacillus piezotolerans TaxID=2448030 RepID=A0A498D6H6_9BACI|nr:nucleoside-diphosphate sugar epimerase/dehydratase [Oceanobacillus piezotolerans]RLL42754.1 polysaccharide biosynthesis protein [Oceanobacillus piezotolerans]